LSDVKDEIDCEFVGADLTTEQTNLYWQALPYYGNTANISGLSDTFENWHNYTIDWSPDQIVWSVDGQAHRTKTRASTWNETSQLYNYPQTPSRIEFSIWPGGGQGQALGTVDWAGGYIDWNSPDIQQTGYYYMQVSQVTVECYPPPPGTRVQGKGSVSYIYDNTTTTFLNNSVIRMFLFWLRTNRSV
jgi:beta-glucanase (GH16 family)